MFYRPNVPLAVVEAKDNKHNIADGIQQALKYAGMLDVPFAFSSNGDGFRRCIHRGNVIKCPHMRKKYKTDLTDEQWAEIAPLFVGTRNRKWEKRALVNAVLYLVDNAANGEPCRMISHLIQQYTVFIAVRD